MRLIRILSMICLLIFYGQTYALAPNMMIVANVDGPVPLLPPNPQYVEEFIDFFSSTGRYIEDMFMSDNTDDGEIMVIDHISKFYRYSPSKVLLESFEITPIATEKVQIGADYYYTARMAQISCVSNKPPNYTYWAGNSISGSVYPLWQEGQKYMAYGTIDLFRLDVVQATFLPSNVYRTLQPPSSISSILAFDADTKAELRNKAFGTSVDICSNYVIDGYNPGTTDFSEMVSDNNSVAVSSRFTSTIHGCPSSCSYVYVFDHGGNHQLSIGGINTTDDNGLGYRVPTGIALTDTEVYIADKSNRKIKVFDRTTGALNRTIGSAGTGDGQFSASLRNIDIDDGYLYVADHGNDVVHIFNLSGVYITKIDVNNPFEVRVTDSYIYI